MNYDGISHQFDAYIMILRSIALATISAVSLSACVQVPIKPVEKPITTQWMTMNGVSMTFGGTFDLGEFSDMPRVRSMSDIRNLSIITSALRGTVARQIKNGDYAGAMVTNQMAARYADYQAHVATATRVASQSLLRNGDGRTDLAPGSYAVLPAFSRYEAPAKLAFSFWPYGTPQDVAAADPDTMIDAIGGFLKAVSPPAESPTATTLNAKDAVSLPLDSPVTLANGAVLERTGDSFVLHNPKATSIQIDLQRLGYLPPIRKPSEARIAAGKILAAMNEVIAAPVRDGFANNVDIAAPNKVVVNRGQMRTAALRVTGEWARNAQDAIESRDAYTQRGHPFRLAIDARVAAQNFPERSAFRSQCAASLQGPYQKYMFFDLLKGAYGEIFDLTCEFTRNKLDKEGEVIYSRRFYITEEGAIQSWASLLKDKNTAQELERLDTTTAVTEDMVGLLPIIGNLESGLKCLDKTTLTKYVRGVIQDNRALESSRAFVSNLYSTPPSSLVSQASDCASALPLVGFGARHGINAAKMAGLGKFIGQNSKDFSTIMRILESGLKSKAKWETITADMTHAGVSASNPFVRSGKSLYDILQGGKSVADVVNAVTVFSGSV